MCHQIEVGWAVGLFVNQSAWTVWGHQLLKNIHNQLRILWKDLETFEIYSFSYPFVYKKLGGIFEIFRIEGVQIKFYIAYYEHFDTLIHSIFWGIDKMVI